MGIRCHRGRGRSCKTVTHGRHRSRAQLVTYSLDPLAVSCPSPPLPLLGFHSSATKAHRTQENGQPTIYPFISNRCDQACKRALGWGKFVGHGMWEGAWGLHASPLPRFLVPPTWAPTWRLPQPPTSGIPWGLIMDASPISNPISSPPSGQWG